MNALDEMKVLSNSFQSTAAAMGLQNGGTCPTNEPTQIESMQMKVKALKDMVDFERSMGEPCQDSLAEVQSDKRKPHETTRSR